MPSTTARCGFLASRQATSELTTVKLCAREQPAQLARGKAGVALAVARGHLVLLVAVEAQHDEPAAGA